MAGGTFDIVRSDEHILEFLRDYLEPDGTHQEYRTALDLSESFQATSRVAVDVVKYLADRPSPTAFNQPRHHLALGFLS